MNQKKRRLKDSGSRYPQLHFSVAIRFLSPALAFVAAFSNPVFAEPWEYGVTLDLGIIHSDNIRLAEDGMEESDSVYQVSPTISLLKASDRLNANINYTPQALFYEKTQDADEVYHELDASLEAALIRERLFLDLSGVNFQVINGAENRFTTSNIPINPRRIDAAIWSASPRWQQQLGPAQLLARATYRQTNFNEFEPQVSLDNLDSKEKSGEFRLDNLNEQQGVAWGLQYRYVRLDYDGEALPWEYQRASAELGYWLGGNLRVFVSGGIETPYDAFLEPDMDDDFYEVGFAFSPNERLDLELAAGERSFGNSFRGRLAYRMRRGETLLTYSEEPATQNTALSGRRPVQQTDNLDDFLTRLNNNQFIRKRAEWASSLELNKTTITLRLFREDREEVFTLDGAFRPDESFHGVALRLNWDAGAKLSLGLGGDIADREGGLSEEELTRYSFDASYRLSRRFTVTARAQHTEGDSQGTGFGNYSENQYHLLLRTEIL